MCCASSGFVNASLLARSACFRQHMHLRRVCFKMVFTSAGKAQASHPCVSEMGKGRKMPLSERKPTEQRLRPFYLDPKPVERVDTLTSSQPDGPHGHDHPIALTSHGTRMAIRAHPSYR